MQQRERVAPQGPPTSPGAAQRESFLSALGSLVAKLPGLFGDRIDLLSLELQLAGLALVQLLLWGVAAAMLLLTAWLGLWSALAAAAVHAGLAWPWAVLGVVLINLLAAWAAISAARRVAPRLGLPLTRRHLDFRDATPSTESAEAARHEELH